MSVNQRQHEAWNGGESVHYVDHADRYDRQLAPFSELLVDRLQLESHHSLLDIGCGCGATTLIAARRARSALGLDLSEPLLEIATARARSESLDNAEFVVTDAQTHDLAEGAFDRVISQFGIMFFDDPVKAFSNLRRALAPDGRAAFISWQGLEANEWLSIVGKAVAEYVELPDFGGMAGGPGMFALKDSNETVALLAAAGFTNIESEAISPSILLGGGGSFDESVDFLLGMGMVRGLLGLADPEDRAAALEAVTASLAERYEPGVGIRLGTGAWLVSARK